MNDKVLEAAGGGGAKKLGWLDGRARRREYWAWVAPALATGIGLSAAGVHFVSYAASLLIFLVTIRRLHDIGWSGYIAPAINISIAVVGLALAAFLAPEMATGIRGLVSTVVWITLGVIPGQAFGNRYGAPPGKADTAEVFS